LTALDRIAHIGATSIVQERHTLAVEAIKSLARAYHTAGSREINPDRLADHERNRPARLKEVSLRAFALGALCMQYAAPQTMAELILQKPLLPNVTDYWSRWTITTLARNGAFAPSSTLLPAAVEYIKTQPYIYDHLRSDENAVLTLLCQFDFLQCLLVSFNSNNDIHRCYPKFGAYYNERVDPALRALVKHEWPRTIFSTMITEQNLTTLVKELDQACAREFFSTHGWAWNDWSDGEIKAWLNVPAGRDLLK
jgi:hypothetical protein